jgi:hypothetical protein
LASGAPPIGRQATAQRRLAPTIAKIGVSAGLVAILLFRVPFGEVVAAATSAGIAGYLGVTLGLIAFSVFAARPRASHRRRIRARAVRDRRGTVLA